MSEEKLSSKMPSALEATIKLGAGIAVDAYMVVPSAVIRYGLSYAGELLGYASNYFLRLTEKNPKKLEALRRMGYTDDPQKVKVKRSGKRGASVAYTVDLKDFSILIEHEAVHEKNPKAIALLTASFREILRTRTLEAFGLVDDSLEYKLEAFAESALEREQVYAQLREEVEDLWLPADTEHYPDMCDWEDYRDLLEERIDFEYYQDLIDIDELESIDF